MTRFHRSPKEFWDELTLAQIVILANTERDMQRKADKPKAQPGTTMDALGLQRLAGLGPPVG